MTKRTVSGLSSTVYRNWDTSVQAFEAPPKLAYCSVRIAMKCNTLGMLLTWDTKLVRLNLASSGTIKHHFKSKV